MMLNNQYYHYYYQHYLFCAQYNIVKPFIDLNIHAYFNYTYDEVIKQKQNNPVYFTLFLAKLVVK